VRGEGTLTGVVGWVGESKARTAWEARYGTPTPRYGIRVEGRAKMIFRDHGAKTLAVTVPGWTDEDRAAMIERAEDRARHDFREALRLADEREPLPAAPAPGDVVDSQEEDETGMRLYAVGESFCEDGWAQQVAAAVVDESAAEYSVMGHRADGSKMAAREVTVFRALGMVARWVENDGARVCHDGRGVVRIVREDGARLMLAPVRPVEAAQGPQEDGERPGADVETQEAAKGAETAQEGPCTHPSECGAQPVGMVRATKAATGEGGIVGVYCSGHLAHPAEIFPEGYVFAYEALSAPVEGVEGTEGDPVWVARRDEALEVLRGLMDGGAGRYRRTVLIEGTDARGMSDTMPTAVARVYLAEEVADGGEVSKPGMGVRLVLVRENGARLELEPVRGVA
jgi:hypothetical protein